MFDITLIENIYIFLTNLEKDNFICKDIKLKVVGKQRDKLYFITYNNLSELYQANKDILDYKKPNKYCILGDFPFIENIKFTNNVTNYDSEYRYYNVTSNDPKCRDKTKFDSNRNTFYEFDKSKYIEYLKTNLVEHNIRNIELANLRLNVYVDACYVDPGYVENTSVLFDENIEDDLK